jgi:HPt (histidine-containing phosphotransfer) domain-containing protein
MENTNQNPLISSRAYPLFLSELNNSLSAFGEALFHNKLKESSGRASFAIVFHKIKGSSGFFGFQEIYSIAGLIEDLLKKEDFKKNHDNKDIESLFEQLKEEAAKLPKPE